MPTWRDTIFVWKGSLKDAEWDGSWVGVVMADATAAATPTAQDFSSSANLFTLSLEEEEGGAKLSNLQILAGNIVTAVDGVGYLLDQGDGNGHRRYKDHVHRVKFCRYGEGAFGSDLMVAAVGSNEFGPFVSLGKFCEDNQLVLARRYLDQDDARCAWTLQDLDDAAGPFNTAEPWQSEALSSKTRRKSTKRKVTQSSKVATSKKGMSRVADFSCTAGAADLLPPSP
mmetsp:Transcript_15260/g.22356  ORF Transcript_15260/g.22356 Transcript_15260/m.22356 type:complete len:227 (-) Transcript_15260:98-778(-)